MVYTQNDIDENGRLDFWAEFDWDFLWQDRLTCNICEGRNICEFAGDPYNTDGDCLWCK